MEKGLIDELYFRRRRYGSGGGDLPWQTFTGNPLQFTAPKAHALKSVKVEFSPKQDLHGYDAPWPAGGGVNQWDEEWEEGRLSWTGENYGDATKIRTKGFVPVIEGETYRIVTSNNLQIFYYGSNKEFVSYESSSKANQNTITVPTGCDYLRFYTYGTDYGNVYKHDIAINYPATVTTYNPYSNICPISGWTGLDIYRAGENLWHTDFTNTDGAGNVKKDGEFICHQAGTTTYLLGGSAISIDYILPKGTYTLTAESDKFSGIFLVYGDNNALWNSGETKSFANPTTIKAVRCATANIENDHTYTWRIMLNLGSTALPYEPYDGHTYSITWQDEAGTVYGGTAEVAEDGSGSGEDGWEKIVFNGTQSIQAGPWLSKDNTRAWIYNYNVTKHAVASSASDVPFIKCESLPTVSYSAIQTDNIGISAFAGTGFGMVIRVADTSISSQTDINNYLAQNPITVVFKKATPVPFTVTVTGQPTAVQGINTMWTDGDNLTVEARAEAVNLSALQSLNMLLGGRYYNNGTADEPTDEEALNILLGGNTK